MKQIAQIDYKDMKFEFITDHWDIHLNGLCRHEGKLCYFDTVDNEDEEINPLYYLWYTNPKTGEKHQYPFFRSTGEVYCNVYSLSFLEKCKYQWTRFWFEFCIGHHWSYPNRKFHDYSDSKPRWLRKILWMIYYRTKRWPRFIAGDSL